MASAGPGEIGIMRSCERRDATRSWIESSRSEGKGCSVFEGGGRKSRIVSPCHIHLPVTACESWTLKAELQRRIQAMEMRCYRKIPCILYKDRVTSVQVCAKIQQAIRPHEDLLSIVKRRRLKWHEHVSRSSGLTKTILQGTVRG